MSLLRDALKLRADAAGLFDRVPTGCSPMEIDALEKKLGHSLPGAYREFLTWVGHDHGDLFPRARCAVGDFEVNRLSLEEVLRANELGHVLPEEFLVFLGDDGRKYAWFALPKESDDPPVTVLNLDADMSGDDLARLSLSQFVLDELKSAVAWREEQSRQRPAPSEKLVTVASYLTPTEANLALVALEADGVRAVLLNESSVAGFGSLTNLGGGVKIQVDPADAERARQILNANL